MSARRRWMLLAVVIAVGAVALIAGPAPAGAAPRPDLGPNVIVLDPSMPQATIQATLDRISTEQVPSQFGTGRYAIFFEPGTYGSAVARGPGEHTGRRRQLSLYGGRWNSCERSVGGAIAVSAASTSRPSAPGSPAL